MGVLNLVHELLHSFGQLSKLKQPFPPPPSLDLNFYDFWHLLHFLPLWFLSYYAVSLQ